jgi:hypothetical protein
MSIPTLIYCAGGNRRLAEIAAEAGFRCGAQLPDTIYLPLYFADQDWRRPDRQRYMAALAEHKPYMATVIDWERAEQLAEVLDWAEEASEHVSVVMVVPKVQGGIERLPARVGKAEVRLGYSVPSSYGASELMLTEFTERPVHLLGGNPWRQMELAHYLDVRSVDGNSHQGAAVRWCMVWTERRWERLQVLEGTRRKVDAPYEAFRRSCVNIAAAWRKQSPIRKEND